MELDRFIRVVQARWLVLVVTAIVGVITAWGFTAIANQSQDPVFEATAPLRFEPQEGQTTADIPPVIAEAQNVATIAASNLLTQDPSFLIQPDPSTARLLFIAQGPTEDEAREKAQALIQAFFDFNPELGGAVDDSLRQLEDEARQLEAQIEELQPTVTPEQEQLISEIEVLDQQITALTAKLVELTVQEAAPAEMSPEEISQQRARVEALLAQLQTERRLLGPIPEPTTSVEDELQLTTLQRRSELVQNEYDRLYLRKLGVTGLGRPEPVVVEDVTPAPANPILNSALGLVGGAGLGVFALIFATRARKPIWLTEDLPIPVVGAIPGRKISNAPGPSWYDVTVGGSRKAAIQHMRTAMEGMIHHSPAAFAVAQFGVAPIGTHALSADLAISFASAGWSVLLVDADFANPSDMSEFNVGSPTLGDVLNLNVTGPAQLDARLSRIVEQATFLRTDLAVLPVGELPASPGDAVAGRHFRAFLEHAAQRFDLVIAVAGEAGAPAAQTIMQRLGGALVTVSPGRSTIPDFNALVSDLEKQRINLLGAAMVYRSESPRKAARAQTQEEPDTPVKRPPPSQMSPVNRLRHYPLPGSTGPGPIGKTSLSELVTLFPDQSSRDDNANAETDTSLGAEVLVALQSVAPAESYEAVAEYVVSRVEDMLTAVPGQGNVSAEIIDVVQTYGFVPLQSVRGHPSVGDRLVSEIRDEVGKDLGEEVASQIRHVLASAVGRQTVELDEWLAMEFFQRHNRRTDREPIIWHLRSQNGTANILVNGQNLTQERLSLLNTEVVRRMIDDRERRLRDVGSGDVDDSAVTLEEELKELHLFEISIGWLMAGSNESAKIVYPWRRSGKQPQGWEPIWSEGIRPNIAPLQRIGLLAEPVLTEQELYSLNPVG